jgi:hypothetical protein
LGYILFHHFCYLDGFYDFQTLFFFDFQSVWTMETDLGSLFFFLLPSFALFFQWVEKVLTERTASCFLEFGLGFVQNSKLGMVDWMTPGIFLHRVLVLDRWIAQYAITIKLASDAFP